MRLTRPTPKTPRTERTAEEDEYLRSRYGWIRPSQIARHIHRSPGSVHHRANKLGLASEFLSSEFLKRQSLPRTAKPFVGFPEPALAAYVAGIIDGEGSIGKPPKVVISVTTTTPELAQRLLEIAGGSITGPYLYSRTKTFGEREYALKPQYHWGLTAQYHVYLLLKEVQPYLIVKAAGARDAVDFFERKHGWGSHEAGQANGSKDWGNEAD